MATIKVLLKTNKPDKRGTLPVYMRISDTSGHRFVSLGIRVPPSAWDEDKERVKGSYKTAAADNAAISKRIAEVDAEVLRRKYKGEAETADGLKAADAGDAPSDDLYAFADAWSADLKRQGRIHYMKRLDSVFRKLKRFTGSPFPIERLTPQVLKRFQAHLIEDLKNSPNTAVVNLSMIRTVVRRAVKEGHVEPGANPFLKFSPVKQTKPSRTKLTVEEIQAIEDLDLKPGSLIDVSRDAFLFTLYCAGVRFGDLANLRWKEIVLAGGAERLDYRMGKTGVRKSIKLKPRAVAILDKYRPASTPKPDDLVFPLLVGYDLSTPEGLVRATSSRNAKVNALLKDIAELAEVYRPVSFHVSRHSFADLARRRGADVYKISKALGHSSLKVTQTYLAGFDDGAADEVVDDVLDW